MSEVHERQLLPIGEVAKRANLTVKALRHYHELGLLVPSAVDPWTGYRAYGPAELERARAIATLRELELPLAEMPVVLDDPGSPAADALLAAHRERLLGRNRQLSSLVDRLDAILEGRSMSQPTYISTPVYREGAARATATMTVTTNLEEIGRVIGETVMRAYGALRGAGIPPAGPSFTRYVEDPNTGEPFQLEVGVVVASTDGLPAGLEAGELPGGRQVVVEHTGPYDRLSASWASFYSWVRDQDLPLTGAPWEAYVRDPGDTSDPDELVTEMVFPLEAESPIER